MKKRPSFEGLGEFFERMDRGDGEPRPMPRWLRRKLKKGRKGGCGARITFGHRPEPTTLLNSLWARSAGRAREKKHHHFN